MKLTGIITAPLAILLGAIILKIFLPWWFVTLIVGAVIVFAVYKWMVAKTGVNAGWAKKVATIAIAIFLVNLALTYLNQKWPWLSKALRSRELYTSFVLTDKADPKYPERLAMELYQTERLAAELNQQKYILMLKGLQAKMSEGKEPNEEEKKILKGIKQKLSETQKEMAGISLSQPASVDKTPQKQLPQSPYQSTMVTPSRKSQNFQMEESSRPMKRDPIKTTEPMDRPTKREPELAFLGKDFRSLTFMENAYAASSRHLKIQLTSVEILSDNNLKLDFLHTALERGRREKEVLIWIKNPESNIYLIDNLGRRYNFIREENLGTYEDRKGERSLGGKPLHPGVPISYSLIFSGFSESIKEINFVSNYYYCNVTYPDGKECLQSIRESLVIRGIKLFKEKG